MLGINGALSVNPRDHSINVDANKVIDLLNKNKDFLVEQKPVLFNILKAL